MKSLILKAGFLILISSVMMIGVGCKKETKKVETTIPEITYNSNQIYHYSYTSIDGKPVKLSDYKGKKIMFVNTASLCSNTPQYEKLQTLYDTYKAQLVIIGFPCNQFGGQDPGSNTEIKDFCSDTYHITFPLSQKIDVKGTKQDSIYTWLTKIELNGKMNSSIAWNFQKYLVDEEGNLMNMFENTMPPDDPSIIAAIKK